MKKLIKTILVSELRYIFESVVRRIVDVEENISRETVLKSQVWYVII